MSIAPLDEYRYWLYDPRHRQFVANHVQDSLFNPVFHLETKTISTNWCLRFPKMGETTYQWSGDTLKTII